MKEKLPAGLCDGQIAEFVEDDEVLAGEIIGDATLAAGARLGLEPIDEIDGGEEAAARSCADAASREADSRAEDVSPARRCPCCGGRMIIVETFEGPRPWRSSSPSRIRIDTS